MVSRREMPPPLVAEMLGRLAIALAAGIDLRRAWQMEAQRMPAGWRPRLEPVGTRLAAGAPLAEALAAAGDTFSPLVRGMVAVGDQTGHEAETLRELSALLQRTTRTTRQLRQSLAGPAFQLAVAVAVVGLLILVAGAMPRDILGLGLRGVRGLVIYLAWIVGSGVVGWLLYGRAVASWRRHGVVRLIVDRVPVIGAASRAAEAAAWCRVASLGSGTGLPVGRLLGLASGVAPGLAVDAAVVEERLRSGAALAEALDRTGRFPLQVLEVIAVGEAAGSTAEVLDRLAGQLDEEAREGFAAAARGAGFLVWAAVAGVIALIVFRIASFYVGAIRDAAAGL